MPEPYSPLLSRKALIGGSEETTSGSAETISAALSNTSIYDAKLVLLDSFAAGDRRPQGHYLGQVASVVGKQLGQLTFRQELRYGDQFCALLTGAGFYLDSTVYKPTSSMDNRETWTLALWEDGRKKQIHGACADLNLEWTNGGPLIANWTWTGVWDAPVDQAMPAQAPSTHTTALYRARGMTLTLGAAAMPMTSRGSIALGNTVNEREDVTATQGVLHMLVADRDIRITLDTESRLVAEGAPFAALAAMTEAALSVVFGDEKTPENTLTIGVPKAQRIAVGDGDRAGKRIDELTLAANANSGDDELTFTPAAGS